MPTKRFLFAILASLTVMSLSPRAAISDSEQIKSEHASVFAAQVSKIEATEKDLENFTRGLAEQKLSIADLDLAYASLIKDMTPEQRNNLAKNNLEALPASLQQKAKDYQALQLKVDQSLKELMDRTDALVKQKLDYVIDVTMDTHLLVKQELLPAITEKKARHALKPLMDKIESLFQSFKNARDLYGKPVDGPTRIRSYRNFFSQVQLFDKQLASLEDKGLVPVEKAGLLRRAREKIMRVFAELANLAKLVPELGRMARVAFFPKASAPGNIHFSSSLNKTFRKVAEVMNIPVEIEGRDRIPTSSDPKVVNVFTPTHRHAFNDSLVMSHFMPDDALLFGAGDQFVGGVPGKILANMLDKADGFVMVGRGSDKPIDEAVEQMKSTGSRNLFIYPEGGVSTGLGETRPPRPKFSSGLLIRLKNEGYKVNLIPITYLNSDRIFHMGDAGADGDDKTLRAKIHDPVTPERLEMMLNSGDEQMVNRYLRGVWLSELPTDENRISGQWRLSALNTMVPKMLYQERGPSWSFCIQNEILKRLSR